MTNINSYLLNRQKFINKHLIIKPKIIIDAVCFQFNDLEMQKIWRSLFNYWSEKDFAKHLVILNRNNTAPKFEEIRYRNINYYDPNNGQNEREMLQFICDEEKADLFISTYFTTAQKTSSIILINDLFPEVNKANFEHPLLKARIEAIKSASHYICTTMAIAQDFQKIYQIADVNISVIYGGVSENYRILEANTVKQFQYRYGIHKPYFLLSNLDNQQNIGLFLNAFSQLPMKNAFDIVVIETDKIPPNYRQITEGCTWHNLTLDNAEMLLAYHGAIALINSNFHDGFNSRIVEAMACGCPIITSINTTIAEIAGDAAVYVENEDIGAMIDAIYQVQIPHIRQKLILTGLQQVSQFSWAKSGEIIKNTLLDLIIDVKLTEINYLIFPDWQTEEEILGEEFTIILDKLSSISDNQEITLLIDTTGIETEEANLFISAVTMNLLLNLEVEIPDNLNFSLLPNLKINQWQKILPQVTAIIKLPSENQDKISEIEGEFLPSINGISNNYLLSPDWQINEEILTEELFAVIRELASQNIEANIIINTTGVELETANLLISDIALNLLLETEIDISEYFSISFISNLTQNQWQNLLSLTTKITLENENKNPFISSFHNQTAQDMTLMLRKSISFRYLSGEGIEIGALHSPLEVSPQAKVKYVDRFPVSELRRHYRELDNLPLVEVDIVDDGEKLSSIEDLSLDFVIANHMIEHCENPIATIKRHLQVLKPNGILYLAIPDKRYTFDFDRPCTTLEHLIKDYQKGGEWSRKSHFEEWVRLVDKKTEAEVLQKINSLMDMNYSIHFHVWTQSEFLELLLYCRNRLHLPFEIELIQNNGGEFITVLKKTNSFNQNETSFELITSSLKKLDINNQTKNHYSLKIAIEIWQLPLEKYSSDNVDIIEQEYNSVNLDLFASIPVNANRILEFGCGAGLIGDRYKLINPNCEYIGVESHQEKVHYAESRLNQVINANISNFNSENLDIESQNIDCLIYNNTLEYFANSQEILIKHLSLLKDESYIIICVDNQQHWSRILNLFTYNQNNSEIVNKLPIFNLNNIENILNNCGLQINKIIPSKNFPPSPEFIKDSQAILDGLNTNTRNFEEIITSLQYVIVAQKISKQVEKPLLIHTRISQTICRLMRLEYPHYCLQTNPHIKIQYEENNDFKVLDFDGDKIFIWQRPFLDYNIELETALAKQKQLIDAGYLTIMELDDNPISWKEETRNKFYILAKSCHGIQTSTEKLAQEMSKFNSYVAYFSNQLPYILPYNKTFSQDKITLLFAAQNRQPDWQIIIQSLNEIIAQYSDQLYVKVIYDRAFYDALETNQKEFEDWCSYSRYQEILQTCDINLIPLENNQFNSMKSDLKFIESAAYGVISLASQTVYEDTIIDGETGIIYHSLDEFKNKLIELINHQELREKISLNAYSYVKNHRLLSQHYQERIKWYKNIINDVDYCNAITQNNYQENLLHILEEEANLQEKLGNLNLTYDIREKIRETYPQNINNLLKLVLLKISLNIFKIEDIKPWNIANLLRENKEDEIDKKLLLLLVEILLELPFDENIDLADAIYNYFEGNDNINELFLSKAMKIGQEKGYAFYAAKLTEICFKNQPDNLDIFSKIISYYSASAKYEKVQSLCQLFYESAKTLPEKTVALRFLISNAITLGNWQQAISIFPEYKKTLQELVKQQPDIQEAYIRNSLSMITQPLLYFDDEAREKRLIINGVAQLFQKLIRNNYSYPVHFLSPEKKNLSRKLKIGYIGRTMRSHPVGFLTRWLIHHHDREKFAIYTYFVCHQQEDEITQEFFRKNTQAHNSTNVVNDLITQIEKDEIDILVDLDSFTENMTSIIMALKPAPIQVSWLGLDSNGIPANDYFIVDPHVLPNDAQDYYSEKIWRLPNTYLAIDGFELGIPSLTKEDLSIPTDALVYMSLQTELKRHPDCIRLQMKILARVSNSYFLIAVGSNEAMKDNVIQLFTKIAQEEGVNPERIVVLPFLPLHTYRANLIIGDVVLDTYPFNGATTTLDALWLNIPLVTKAGQQFHARQGYTLLTNLGITEGIAWSDEEYIEWGVKLGTDENLRKQISWKLRQSKKSSPLWNGKQFTREMEKAYQQMWEIYVNQK